MTLLIDNYDSFSYNLYQLVGSIDPEIRVIRNDEMTIDEIRELFNYAPLPDGAGAFTPIRGEYKNVHDSSSQDDQAGGGSGNDEEGGENDG